MTTMEPEVAPQPGQYLPEPQYTDDQDDVDNVLLIARGFVQPTAPRTFGEALDWLAKQSVNPSQNWAGLCQKCMRSADGCPGGFASAKEQWHGMPDSFRVVGGDPDDAPIGADLFSDSTDPSSSSFRFGHIIKKARPFKDGTRAAWSTDALRVGMVDKIDYKELYARWGHRYLGWGYNINGRIIDVKDPKPAQTEPYHALGDVVVLLERALDKERIARSTANDLGDLKDFDEIQNLIERTRDLKQRVAKKHDNLRHV